MNVEHEHSNVMYKGCLNLKVTDSNRVVLYKTMEQYLPTDQLWTKSSKGKNTDLSFPCRIWLDTLYKKLI